MKNFINHTSYSRKEDIKRLKFIQDAIISRNSKDLNILEIGCGNGHICYQLAKNDFEIRGIDLCPNTIENAKATYKHEKLSFEVKNAETLVSGKPYDVIIMSEVLEHLNYPDSVLGVVSNLLKPNGISIITVPNGYGPREVFITKPVQKIYRSKGPLANTLKGFKMALGYKGVTVQSANNDLTHIQFFSLKDLHALAKKNGLKIIKVGAANLLDGVFPFSFITKRSKAMQSFDCWVADKVPIKWASGFNTVMIKEN